jgi:hypothetical protein
MTGRVVEFVEGTHEALRIVTMVGNSYYCNEVSREDGGLDGGQIGIHEDYSQNLIATMRERREK